MPFQLDFTDEFGENYPKSYWECATVNTDLTSRTARTVFLGYPDEAHKGKRVIGQKEYILSGDEYEKYLSSAALDVKDINQVGQAYVQAKASEDTDSGAKDKEGEPVLQSFFAKAEDV